MTQFTGFTEETTRFLRGLEKNNDKAWFEAHRAQYEEKWLRPAAAFVDALGARLQAIEPKVQYAAKIDQSIVRLYRDQRFATTKEPFKTWFELRFWTGDRQAPAFWLKLTSTRLTLAAGIPFFETRALKQYRALAAGPAGRALEGFGPLRGLKRKTVPKPYPADHPRAELLKHDGLYAADEDKVPRAFKTADFVDHCLARYRKMVPLTRWLEKVG